MNNGVYDKRAKDVMCRHLVTIDVKDSVHEALQLMAENKVATLPVVDHKGRCVGIVSTSDLVEVTRTLDAGLADLENSSEPLLWGQYLERLGDNVGHQSVSDLMSDSVVSIGPDTPVYDVAGHMLREHIHRLPVIDAEGHLLGIVSMTDILSAFVECAPAKKADSSGK